MSFFDYFQIVSLVLFLLVIAAKALYLLLTQNLNPIVVGRGKKGLQFAFEMYAFVGLAIWMIEGVLYSLHKPHIFPPPLDLQLIDATPVKVIGVGVITLGLIILIWAIISFGRSWRVGFDLKTPGDLVTSGVFDHSRNPIYVFLNLWFAGVFLIHGTLFFLISSVLAFAHLHYQIIREETFLMKLYGQAFKDYCARTGRYLRL